MWIVRSQITELLDANQISFLLTINRTIKDRHGKI